MHRALSSMRKFLGPAMWDGRPIGVAELVQEFYDAEREARLKKLGQSETKIPNKEINPPKHRKERDAYLKYSRLNFPAYLFPDEFQDENNGEGASNDDANEANDANEDANDSNDGENGDEIDEAIDSDDSDNSESEFSNDEVEENSENMICQRLAADSEFETVTSEVEDAERKEMREKLIQLNNRMKAEWKATTNEPIPNNWAYLSSNNLWGLLPAEKALLGQNANDFDLRRKRMPKRQQEKRKSKKNKRKISEVAKSQNEISQATAKQWHRHFPSVFPAVETSGNQT